MSKVVSCMIVGEVERAEPELKADPKAKVADPEADSVAEAKEEAAEASEAAEAVEAEEKYLSSLICL